MLTSAILILHIVSGFLALGCGAIAIGSKKGKRIHIRFGRIYFWSMIWVAVTAVYLSVVKTIPFLFLIAVFSFYLTWTGYKSIHWKNRDLPVTIYWFDAIVIHITVFFGIVMVSLALMAFFDIYLIQGISSLSIVLLVFGVGTLLFSAEDLIALYRKKSRSHFLWMYIHIGRMLGAYIATLTAFLVVNSEFFPSLLIAWLGPSAIGTPLIIYWIRRYKRKLEPQSTF